VATLRGFFTEIRLDAFLSEKHFKFIGIVNQWIGYACWSQKYDRTPSFLWNPWISLVLWISGMVTRFDHRNTTGILPLSEHFKFVAIVNQWLGYASWSQKYDRTPSILGNTTSSLVLWISDLLKKVDHRYTTGRLPFCETLQVHWYCESVTRWRVLITEIRQDPFLSAEHFKFIGIDNLWLGDAGCSQKYDKKPSFLPTLQECCYCESVARLRGLFIEMRLDAFLSAKPFKFIVIVNQWLGDAGWSQKYDRKTSFLRNPWSSLVFRLSG
jgi:hypothetical protein